MKVEMESENQNFKNFKDVRPLALEQAKLKQRSKMPLNPGPNTQAVLTNQFIAQKIKESEDTPAEPIKKKGPSSTKSGHSNSSSGIIKTVILPHEDINRMNGES